MLFRNSQLARGLAFLPRTTAKRFLQQFTESEACLVQLRLGITARASQNRSYLMVFVSLDIVQDEHFFVSIWQLLNGPAQIHVVNHSAEPKVRPARFYGGPRVFLCGFERRVERHLRIPFLAESHEHKVRG
jgi:hypothetical protein